MYNISRVKSKLWSIAFTKLFTPERQISQTKYLRPTWLPLLLVLSHHPVVNLGSFFLPHKSILSEFASLPSDPIKENPIYWISFLNNHFIHCPLWQCPGSLALPSRACSVDQSFPHVLLLEISPREKLGFAVLSYSYWESPSIGNDNFPGHRRKEYSTLIVLLTFAFIFVLLGETIKTWGILNKPDN